MHITSYEYRREYGTLYNTHMARFRVKHVPKEIIPVVRTTYIIHELNPQRSKWVLYKNYEKKLRLVYWTLTTLGQASMTQ